MEELRPIPGYEDRYSITRDGRIWSHRRRIWIKPKFNSQGYYEVSLSDGRRMRFPFVHTLVLTTYGPPRPSEEHQVNHINYNNTDNHIENLEWVLPENNKRRPPIGEANPKAKLTVHDVIEIRRRYVARCPTNGINALVQQFGVGRSAIIHVLWKHHWKDVVSRPK